jgi:hypothetical protein
MLLLILKSPTDISSSAFDKKPTKTGLHIFTEGHGKQTSKYLIKASPTFFVVSVTGKFV